MSRLAVWSQLTTLLIVSLGILNLRAFFPFPPFFPFTLLNRKLNVDKASADPSFVNKQTSHHAGECLLSAPSTHSEHQITKCQKRGRILSIILYPRRELAGGLCRFCPQGNERQSNSRCPETHGLLIRGKHAGFPQRMGKRRTSFPLTLGECHIQPTVFQECSATQVSHRGVLDY